MIVATEVNQLKCTLAGK